MIVTKTPLRISFFGGGSDIAAFYQDNEGLVVSTTINSYIYIALNRCIAEHLKVIYSVLEHTTNIEAIQHDRVRETLKLFEVQSNVEICSFSDVTVKGTGLGASSTFTVGLVNAVYKALNHRTMEPAELAETAAYIEINKCNERIGKQDQYAAAFGGFNAIYFNASSARVKRLKIAQSTIFDLQHNLYLFNTGIARRASDVLREHVEKLDSGVNIDLTKSLVNMAKESIRMLEHNKADEFGNLLDAGWMIKKALSSTASNPAIDEMYELALSGGALGGKILGAGGGGYLLVYAPERERNRLLETMRRYQRLPFKFSTEGSTVEMSP